MMSKMNDQVASRVAQWVASTYGGRADSSDFPNADRGTCIVRPNPISDTQHAFSCN